MNDGSEHSTPLAGYVGASMIYRALYGKMPTAEITYGKCGISQESVNRLLGEYVETGLIYGTEKIRYISLRNKRKIGGVGASDFCFGNFIKAQHKKRKFCKLPLFMLTSREKYVKI